MRIGDLKMREYDKSKNCVRFEYDVKTESQTLPLLRCQFIRDDGDDRVWLMQVVIPKTPFRSAVVYDCSIQMPSTSYSQDITKVSSFGLKFLQDVIKIEVQDLSCVDFAIGDVIPKDALAVR